MLDQKNLRMIFYLKTYLLIQLLFFLSGITSNGFSQSEAATQVKIINVSDLEKIINQNKDRALLINVWATWCLPCREEFPDLVKLAKVYEKEIRVLCISVDDPDELDSKVLPFLKKQNAEYDNYLLKVVEPEDFINLLNKDWGGAIPATFIYDSQGNQSQVLIGKQSYEEFEQSLKKVINK